MSTSITGTIGFLGFGNMGKAIAQGVVAAGIVPAEQILIRDPHLPIDFASSLVQQGYKFASSESELFEQSQVVLLAVKPQVAKAERDNWKTLFSSLQGSGKTFISIMAGIKASFLEEVAVGQVA